MKQGRALSEVLTELQRQNAAKQDFIGPAQAFTLRPDGSTFEIVHSNSGVQEVFGTTDLFHRQIGSTLGIPAKYYDQMRKLKPDLLAENVNAWFADREQSYMIRSMDYGNGRIALSALHWIDRDFKEKFGNAGAPHTKKIKMLRNALEHKFVSVHMFSTENEVKIGKDYIYRISEDNLIECTMDLLQLIREAVIELTIAIRIEEKQRRRRSASTTTAARS